ncbi:MAG: 2-succinyl-6-hydroxy-2,4-cyclohexadiene-1-carboxy late synthase [Ignavibacteriaceae bacterium]
MKIKFREFFLNVELFRHSPKNNKLILLLHGFTGSSADWKPVADNLADGFDIAALDITGHGKSDAPNDPQFYTTDSLAEQLAEVAGNFDHDKLIICGYSMGGRLALSFALRYQNLIDGLVLESTSAGFINSNLRNKRIEEDGEIISLLESKSEEEFIEFWMNRPIFYTQRRFSEEKLKRLKQTKLNNFNKTGTINILKNFGTGIMPPLYDELKNLKIPVLLITGELDTKFTEINKTILIEIESGDLRIIKNSGHNTHLEEPVQFVNAVNSFLTQF